MSSKEISDRKSACISSKKLSSSNIFIKIVDKQVNENDSLIRIPNPILWLKIAGISWLILGPFSSPLF